jgi:hypothetical protein
MRKGPVSRQYKAGSFRSEIRRGRITAVATTPPNSVKGAPFNFSSFHPAGTNFLAADGSVCLVAETIDRQTYHALCTRSDGDVVR